MEEKNKICRYQKWYNNLTEEQKEERKKIRRNQYSENKEKIRKRANYLRDQKKEKAKAEIREILKIKDTNIAKEKILDTKFNNIDLHCKKNIQKAIFILENRELINDFDNFVIENKIEKIDLSIINSFLENYKHKDQKEKLVNIYIKKRYEII